MLKLNSMMWWCLVILGALGLVLTGCPANDDDSADDDDAGDDDAGDDDAGDDDAGDDDSGGMDACTTYCTAALANCSGADTIYATMDQCQAACAGMPEGDPADTSGNTAWCRAYHAGAAAGMPATHCPHASLSGSNVCGSPCDAYCSQAAANCSGQGSAEQADYADQASCLTACALFPSGSWNDSAGDTQECRGYHASFPAAGDPLLHCAHAGTSGGGVCSP
jgi:hypothetical protein